MKKNIKLFVAFVCIISMFLGIVSPVSAQEYNEARYIPCSEGGKHMMKVHAAVLVYNGSSNSNPGKLEFRGTLGKCVKCGLLMACQYWPTGIYQGPGKICQTNNLSIYEGMSVMYSNGPCDVYNTLMQDSWIQGFEFYYDHT